VIHGTSVTTTIVVAILAPEVALGAGVAFSPNGGRLVDDGDDSELLNAFDPPGDAVAASDSFAGITDADALQALLVSTEALTLLDGSPGLDTPAVNLDFVPTVHTQHGSPSSSPLVSTTHPDHQGDPCSQIHLRGEAPLADR
jgi:hypothetical protein